MPYCHWVPEPNDYSQYLPANIDELNFRDDAQLDFDDLYEHHLKIFGDILESLIGAIFLDCRDIHCTWQILWKMLEPYVEVYADLNSIQDHSRTKLLELWNSKSYTRNTKCYHENKSANQAKEIGPVFIGMIGKTQVIKMIFIKETKHKARLFYKRFFKVVEAFLEWFEKIVAPEDFDSEDIIQEKFLDFKNKGEIHKLQKEFLNDHESEFMKISF